jgi:type II secretory pathway pseudopilin PulG
VAQENHTLTFEALSSEQKQAVREDAEESYISYAFLNQSGAQHGNLKVDLRNDFTTGSNRYPKTRQQTLHLFDKYSKTVVVPKTTSSEGSSFAQKGGRGGRGCRGQATITFNNEYWKDKTCFNCGEKGHPSSSCTKAAVTNDDDSTSIAQSVKKLAKDTKNLKKAFPQLQKTNERDSDLSGSESEEEDSHFQFGDGFQFTQMKVKQRAIEFKP